MRTPSLLQAARVARGWSQQEVCARVRKLCPGHYGRSACRLPTNKVSEFETGRKRPTLTHVEVLCQIYETGPEDLGLIRWRDSGRNGQDRDGNGDTSAVPPTAAGADPGGEAAAVLPPIVVGGVVVDLTLTIRPAGGASCTSPPGDLAAADLPGWPTGEEGLTIAELADLAGLGLPTMASWVAADREIQYYRAPGGRYWIPWSAATRVLNRLDQSRLAVKDASPPCPDPDPHAATNPPVTDADPPSGGE